MIFETHAHYDDEIFDEDRDAVLEGMKERGIGHIVNSGASIKGCKDSLSIAEKYDFIYAAMGIHPSETQELTEQDINWLIDTCKKNHINRGGKVVALGEIGLDYHYPEPSRETQKKWFIRQLQAAVETRLPVVIHSRDASKDTIDIIKENYEQGFPGIIHCYSYSREAARDYLNRGFLFGIGGVVTFKNAKTLKDVVQYLPMENILLETDSPYLAPEPYRGSRNSSYNLFYVAEQIGNIKGISTEEVIEITEQNAMKIFGLA